MNASGRPLHCGRPMRSVLLGAPPADLTRAWACRLCDHSAPRRRGNNYAPPRTLTRRAHAAQARILQTLRERGPLSINAIADALEARRATIWRHVEALEARREIYSVGGYGRLGRICYPREARPPRAEASA